MGLGFIEDFSGLIKRRPCVLGTLEFLARQYTRTCWVGTIGQKVDTYQKLLRNGVMNIYQSLEGIGTQRPLHTLR